LRSVRNVSRDSPDFVVSGDEATAARMPTARRRNPREPSGMDHDFESRPTDWRTLARTSAALT
jgi:hypothetical protein